MSKIVNNHHCKILVQTIFALLLCSGAYNAHAEFEHGHDRMGPLGGERRGITRPFDGKLHAHGNRNIHPRHGNDILLSNQTEYNRREHGHGDRDFHNGHHYHDDHNGFYYKYFYNGRSYRTCRKEFRNRMHGHWNRPAMICE